MQFDPANQTQTPVGGSKPLSHVPEAVTREKSQNTDMRKVYMAPAMKAEPSIRTPAGATVTDKSEPSAALTQHRPSAFATLTSKSGITGVAAPAAKTHQPFESLARQTSEPIGEAQMRGSYQSQQPARSHVKKS